MVCPQCQARTEQGARCKNHSCVRYPMCWVHQRMYEGLAQRQSEIPHGGLGVFATRHFPLTKKDMNLKSKRPIAYYSAKQISHEPDPNSSYVLRVNKNQYLNSADPSNMTGRLINSYRNHPDRSKRRANVKFASNQRIYRMDGRYVVPIRQSRPIHKGDELYINYGSAYPLEREV